MRFAIALLAGLLLAAGPPKRGADDPFRFIDPDDKLGQPDNYDSYGAAHTADIFKVCVDAADGKGFTSRSIDRFCSCNTYAIETVLTLDELLALDGDDTIGLFRATGMKCVEFGFAPVRRPDSAGAGAI